MDYEILPPVDDWVFKLLFGDERNKHLLASLLKSFVELPDEEYELDFLDTHLKPEAKGGKLGILDVKVRTKSGKIIDIEIQVSPAKNIGPRLSFYKSMLIVGQIGESDRYSVIQRVICICITDYELFPGAKEYVNGFRFCNRKNGLCFEDIPEEIYTLELPKAPARDDGSGVWQWAQFLRAKTKEEFEMIAAKNPEMRQAIDALYALSADENVRAEYEMRMRAIRDTQWRIDSALDEARKKGREEGVKEGREEGMKEGKEEGKKEGMKEGKKEGMKEGMTAGKKEGKKEGVMEMLDLLSQGKSIDEAKKILGIP